MEELRVGSFFSGIGAFEKALERLEIPHRTVFYCEIDKYASRSYSLIHGISESFNLWDITKINEQELPDFDLMTWGFPCQSISVAGKQEGVQVKCDSCGEVFPISDLDNNCCPFCEGKEIKAKTRSGLYYDGLRILKYKRPKYSIIENVKNLVGKKFQTEFHQMLCDLEDAGYNNYWQVLNAKDYGIPQNRERVFIVSIRKDIDQGFQFPEPFDNGLRLKDLLKDEVDEKYYISQEKTEHLLKSLTFKESYAQWDISGKGYESQPDRAYYLDGIHGALMAARTESKCKVIIPVLTPDREEKRQNGRRFKDDGEPMFSLTTQDRHGILTKVGCVGSDSQGNRVYDSDGLACTQTGMAGGLGAKTGLYLYNYRIRKLTPLECFRLMGFDDADFRKCKTAGISDSQLYKQAGNSIVCNVLEGILNNLLKSGANMPDYFYAEQLALFG